MTENKTEIERNSRKTVRGIVVSDKMTKTRVISVERTTRHSAYAKIQRSNQKFYAHDESNESKTGDKVEITSTRPMSALKRWRISRIIEKAKI